MLGWKLRELVMGARFRHAHIHRVLNLIKAFLAYPVILPIGPAAALYDGVNAHSVYMEERRCGSDVTAIGNKYLRLQCI